MKRTEIERIERELKRTEKKEARVDTDRNGNSVGGYIERLASLFRYDQNEIFNAATDEAILEVIEELKEHIPEKKWDDVLRKSVKKTGVREKDKAVEELRGLLVG